jgi:hypothetical protein
VLFNALVFAVLAAALLGFLGGLFVGDRRWRKQVGEAQARHEALRRHFDTISAVNLQLLRRRVPASARQGEDALQLFLELYDEAKHCLHAALDRHNATAARPIVITRDGGNILEALDELPELSFHHDGGEDAGVRSWLRRVIMLDVARRRDPSSLGPEDVLALDGERNLWGVALKRRA